MRFCAQGGVLRITVEDNGFGMSRETLDGIWSGRRAPDKENSNMIGVRNIADRIQLCYGDAGDLTIDSEPKRGTRVTIHLPCSTGKGEDYAESSDR